MLKVLAMRDTYHVSGPCRGILHLIEETKPMGVHFIIGMFLVGSRLTSPAIEEFKRRGVHVAVWLQKRRYDFGLIPQACKIVREHNVTILQSHGYKPAVLACCLKRLTGLPWVAVVHGYTSGNKRVAFYNRLDLWLTRYADRVIAVSAATGSYLERNGIPKNRIRVIPNAIDPTAYQPEKDGSEFRRCWQARPENLLVGAIGRLSAEKGIDIFLQASQKVIKAIPTAKAIIVGEGQDAARLKKISRASGLEDHVVFAGHQTDISSVYSALDLVVIPSFSEGLPNVLLEAFLHHKAVVATAVGGIPEVMQDKLSRWLVSPGDAAALGNAMIEALQDGRLRTDVGAAGAQLVREMFSPARRASQFLHVYEELVRHRTWPGMTMEPNNCDSKI